MNRRSFFRALPVLQVALTVPIVAQPRREVIFGTIKPLDPLAGVFIDTRLPDNPGRAIGYALLQDHLKRRGIRI